MNRNEILQRVDLAWTQLSQRRGYHVQKDSPVCIHVCQNLIQQIPDSILIQIPIPQHQDFQAIVLAQVDEHLCVVDPVHMVWMNDKPVDEPKLEEATLILPITIDCEVANHTTHADQLDSHYVEAITQFVHQMADSS